MKSIQTLLKRNIGSQAIQQLVNKERGFNAVLKKATVLEAGDGKCVAELKIDTEHINSKKTLHGGLITTLIDNVTAYALKTKLHTTGLVGLSVNINVKFFNIANMGDTILVAGQVIRFGKSLAFLECTVSNKDSGTLVATGTQTMYILPKNKAKALN